MELITNRKVKGVQVLFLGKQGRVLQFNITYKIDKKQEGLNWKPLSFEKTKLCQLSLTDKNEVSCSASKSVAVYIHTINFFSFLLKC